MTTSSRIPYFPFEQATPNRMAIPTIQITGVLISIPNNAIPTEILVVIKEHPCPVELR
jgi:hypothetical protein